MRLRFYVLLLISLFLGCSKNNPVGVGSTSIITLSISWKKNNAIIAPQDIDSVKLTLRSDRLASDRVNLFSFHNGTGHIEELPSGIDLSVIVEGLDATGRVLYSGQTLLSELPSGETSVQVTAVYIIPPDRQGPAVTVLSHKNNDTVNTRIIRLFGQAVDSSRVSLLQIDTATVSCKDNFWDYHGYWLQEGRNLVSITAVDGSPSKNETRIILVLHYIPDYQIVFNHAPRFLVTPGYLSATLKTGQTYHRSLVAADPDEFNALFFRVPSPLQWAPDTSVRWTPVAADTGIHAFHAVVFDQDSAQDSIAWTVRVVDSAVNLPPFFMTRPQDLTRYIYVGDPYSDTLRAADLEQSAGLRYHLVNGPSGAAVDSFSGIVRWVPQTGDVGICWFGVRVTDDSSASDTLFWSITVKHPTVLVFSAGSDTTVSIYDSVYLKPEIGIRSGGITRYEWDIGNTGRFSIRSKADTGFLAPGIASDSLVCILRITITNGDMIEDRVVVTVLQDPPFAFAGKDSIVGPLQTVQISGWAQDKFGYVTKTEWDIGDKGDYRAFLFPDTSFTMPDSVQSFSCIFRVTDDDNNAVLDTVIFRIPKRDMIFLRPDTFFMGSTAGATDEGPLHPVRLAPFYIDSTEVTQKDFQDILGVNPSSYGYQMNDPIESVTWYDAALYCNALSKLRGFDTVYRYTRFEGTPGNNCTYLQNLKIDYSALGFRLPTEAEWEYACRSGSTTDYSWGSETSAAREYAVFGGGVHTSPFPVARKKPNAFGLYDMAGNVWEWCNDWYAPYDTDSLVNPTGPVSGNARIIRGGSWQDNVLELKSANRGMGSPGWKSNFVGFRTVLQSGE